MEEYATKDSKSSNTKKQAEANGNQNKSNVGKNSKRSSLKKRSDKANYSHNWLLTTLKGHTGSVMDMSFSANGKYLATCADGELQLIFLLNCTTVEITIIAPMTDSSLIDLITKQHAHAIDEFSNATHN